MMIISTKHALINSIYGKAKLPGVSTKIPRVITADFQSKTYGYNGDSKTFDELFNFSRSSKAWTANTGALVEWADDVPRLLSNGILLEQKSTNYCNYSFLPETGVTYIKSGVTFINGTWEFTTASDSYLFPRPYPPALSGDKFVTSTWTVMPSTLTYFVLGGSRVYNLIHKDNMCYGVRDTPLTTSASYGVASEFNRSIGTRFLCIQLESGQIPSSPIKTLNGPGTRQADILTLKLPLDGEYTLTGSWDATLDVRILNNQLSITGNGKLQSIQLNEVI